MTGSTGAALLTAYLSAANSPRALLELTHPHADTRGLTSEGVGLMLDPRAGHDEDSPSLSLSRSKTDGAALFSRKGDDGLGWNALTWLVNYGNDGKGMTRGEAACLLIERAGVIDSPAEQKKRKQGRNSPPPRPRLGADLRHKQEQTKAADAAAVMTHLSAWESVTAEQDGPERDFLASRGLLPALGELLEVFRFRGHTGDARKKNSLPRSLLPGAVGFLVRGPDGETVGVKYRNPGSKAELKAASERRGLRIRRYHIPSGLSTPAWCTPDLTAQATEVWTEGELNGVAFAVGLEAAELSGSVGVQGMAGTEGSPHVRHDLTGKAVYIYADPDTAGNTALVRWARQALDLGAVVYLLPYFEDSDPEQDAAAFLGQHGPEALGAWITNHMRDLSPWQDPEAQEEHTTDVWGEGHTVWPYSIQGGGMVKLKRTPDGETEARPLLGFTARITAEVTRDDGGDMPAGAYRLEGQDAEGRTFPAQVVPLKEFRSLNWADTWGASAFVYPGTSIKDEARAAIQRLSTEAGILRETVYTHTGWRDLPKYGPTFLTADACISAAGAVLGVRVELSGRLSSYALPEPVEGETLQAAVQACLALLELTPDSVSVPMLGLTYRAPLGDVNFSCWVSGRTGSGKTTYAALCQSHFGPAWTAKRLPASWQGTSNALTREAFLAKDVLWTLDDFKPEGSQAEATRAHAELSKMLGSVGDRAGRSRLSPDGVTVRTGPYPRGAVLTTAEDTPRKTSDVARTVAVDVASPLFGVGGPPGAAEQFELARQEAASGLYALAMSGFVRWIAEHHAELTGERLRRRVRDSAALFAAPHARTPENSAELLEGWRAWLSFAVSVGAVSSDEAEAYGVRVTEALEALATGQGAHLESTDPVSRFLKLLGSLLRTGAVYVRDAETGEEPSLHVEALGWRWRSFGDPAEGSGQWETGRTGAAVGYLGRVEEKSFLFLEPDAVYAAVNRAAEQGGHALPAQRSLWKRLKERLVPLGAMICQPDRNTHLRNVHGAGTADGRLALLNISYPLSDLNGTNGTDTPPSSAGREKNPVPFLLYFSIQNNLNGTASPNSPSQSEKIPVPFTSSAAVSEQEAERVPVLAGMAFQDEL